MLACLLVCVCSQSPTVKSARSRLAGKKKPEVAWSEVVEGKGAAAEAGMRLADMAAWQMNKGITAFPKPAAWLNGAQVREGGTRVHLPACALQNQIWSVQYLVVAWH
jgi:hypothetical protein